jgi:hypothetical protein
LKSAAKKQGKAEIHVKTPKTAFILDTDHLTILLRQGEPASDRLLRIVGWLGYLNRARRDADRLLRFAILAP